MQNLKDFELILYSEKLETNETFSAAVFLTDLLCAVRLNAFVGRQPNNIAGYDEAGRWE